MQTSERQAHWQNVYTSKSSTEVSWFQDHPASSLDLIDRTGVGTAARVIDVGSGASRLVDGLLDRGFSALTVLDIAAGAFDQARARLGERARAVRWVTADVTTWTTAETFDLWHDRAVFHFLTEEADRAAYRRLLETALVSGGHLIIGTFALDGPERCSNLPVARYDAEGLAAELGPAFRLVETLREAHTTPAGKVQHFQFSRLMKI